MSNAAESDGLDPRVWQIAAVACLGPFMTVLDSTVVNFSLATISRELHASITSTQWIVSAYLLAMALMLPLSGWLVDRLGTKRLYLLCFCAFTLASLFCATAHSIEGLIAARVLQGLAGGLLAPMAQMMMARAAGRHMARIMGYTVVPILIAPILGPVAAGAVLHFAGWPWLFYLNLPIGVLAVVLAWRLLPADGPALQKRPFDLPGFLLISPGLVGLLYGAEHVTRPHGALVLLAGLLLLAGFAWHALRRGSSALVDLRLFGNHTFSTAATTQFLSNGQAFAGQFLVPLYLITSGGLSATQAGWTLAPMGVGMMCSFPLMGFLTERFGCRAVSAGGALLALAGTLPFLWMSAHGFSQLVAMLCMGVRGAGQGAIGIPSVAAAYAAVPKEQLAVATTAINIVQRLGGPLATTAMAITMGVASTHLPASHAEAFVVAFGLLAGLHLLALVSASRLPERVGQRG